MKKEKIYALLCYIVSIGLFLMVVINRFARDDTSSRITLLCLASAMLCFGGFWLNKANKNDEDK